MTNLGGSSVGDVDGRRVGGVLLILGNGTLAVLVVVFSLAGAHRNDQVSRAQSQGVTTDLGLRVLQGGKGDSKEAAAAS
jgi:hypothetical protein